MAIPKGTTIPKPTVKSSKYQTHLQYVKCMDLITKNLDIQIICKTQNRLDVSKIEKYQRLAKVTYKSLSDEVKLCEAEIEYSQVSAPWIPVKSYYYLFYLEAVLLYLLNENTKVFGYGGHINIRSSIKKAIVNNEIKYSSDSVSEVFKFVDILKHKIISGENLRSDFYMKDNCIKSLRSKLVDYSKITFKANNKIKKLSSTKRKEFEENELNLVDYFYQMRIKANYRDLDFLDFETEINSSEALSYIKHYFSAVDSYGNSLNKAIDNILKLRKMI